MCQAEVRGAHDGAIWALEWHPVGHLLASGSADNATRFWCRQRPGDPWRDQQLEEQQAYAEEEGAMPWAEAR